MESKKSVTLDKEEYDSMCTRIKNGSKAIKELRASRNDIHIEFFEVTRGVALGMPNMDLDRMSPMEWKRGVVGSRDYRYNIGMAIMNKSGLLDTENDPNFLKIDNEFLEWFVKNPSCEEVDVADLWKEGTPNTHESYQIIIENKDRKLFAEQIIPKEEPKQEIELLEEAAEKYANEEIIAGFDSLDEFFNFYSSFIEGSKWQAKVMYNEEDMAESFIACWKANVPDGVECKLSFKEWFERLKKKEMSNTGYSTSSKAADMMSV